MSDALTTALSEKPWRPLLRSGDQAELNDNQLTFPLRPRVADPRAWLVSPGIDLFGPLVTHDHIRKILAVVAATPQHTYRIITEHPDRASDLFEDEDWRTHLFCTESTLRHDPERPLPVWPLPNLWLGVPVTCQDDADRLIPQLLAVPAALRFADCRPRGPINLQSINWRHGNITTLDALGGQYGEPGVWQMPGKHLDWVIAAGELGSQAKPLHPNLVRALRNQCHGTGVPFFFTRWGQYRPIPVYDAPKLAGGRAFRHPNHGEIAAVIRERAENGQPGYTRKMRPGDVNGFGRMLDLDTFAVNMRYESGRELDGETWDQLPQVNHG